MHDKEQIIAGVLNDAPNKGDFRRATGFNSESLKIGCQVTLLLDIVAREDRASP